MDSRIENLGKILAKYCVRAKSKELISITSTTQAEPLVLATYEQLIRAGAYPVIQMMPEGASEAFFQHAKPHHLDNLSPHQVPLAKQLAGSIYIDATSNTRSLSKVDPKKQARMGIARKSIRKIMMDKKWCITLFPTAAYAQEAEMTLREFEDFVYSATFADKDDPIAHWKKLKKRQADMIRKLKGAKKVRIVGPDTDLTMSIAGRVFINSPGTHNMPSGEIFTGPVENSAEGYIKYDFPVCNGGREIDGIRLVFRKGKVVEASADKNQKFLLTMLDMDPGARRLGELGIGTNYGIQKFIKSILFDEKIGGTVHLALGESYVETGGKNKSALHWDMIKDLRKGGTLYIDDKIVQKDGKFRI